MATSAHGLRTAGEVDTDLVGPARANAVCNPVCEVGHLAPAGKGRVIGLANVDTALHCRTKRVKGEGFISTTRESVKPG